jgi:hypothetical protein
VSDLWVVELLRWGFTQEKSPTLDVEDAVRTHITSDSTDAQAVVSQMQELENILGSNGTPKWKSL